MRKTFLRLAMIVIAIFIAVHLFTYINISRVEANVTRVNPQIDEIISINSISDWGEWFQYYTLVVKIKDEQYRIRVNESGEVEGIEKL
ncbi:hypothetical protein IEO70_12490 [Bacillus sp. AGMB 02131]|uniref:Uncharacterized protein n=1 Tax=Peribacillus faecalis TaxID=2772559 RepID=A0A927CYT6_9BACI|nr:hypothetical protein [Peribacillus faecalis]MBD3109167.1 hypothetical protein [Peribacillus faecalis]